MSAPPPGGNGLIDHVTNVSDFIWGGTWHGEAVLSVGGQPVPPMTLILLGVGLWIMIGLRFYPIVKFGAAVRGLAVSVRKGLPLAGGQGGSAASAVAAAVATNRLLGDPLDRPTLLAACLAAEEAVAGRHADNVAPSLFGGAVLVRSLDPLDVVCLPVPAELRVVLAHPDQRLRTREARAVLPREVPLELALAQAAVAGIMAVQGHLGLAIPWLPLALLGAELLIGAVALVLAIDYVDTTVSVGRVRGARLIVKDATIARTAA